MKVRCLFLVIALTSVTTLVRSQTPDEIVVKWIDRPWDYRYLLYAQQDRTWLHLRAGFSKDIAKNPVKAAENGEPVESSFDAQQILNLAEEEPESFIRILRLDIGPNRTIVQTNLKGDHLRPRLNWLKEIVLTPSDEKPAYVVDFGYFFMGAPAAVDTRYSPTICSRIHGDGLPGDGIGRYWSGFKTIRNGYFGCREWAAQLYDPERPYIDVTSYETEEDDERPKVKGKYPLKPVTYIRPFVGFSRFDSPPKPVIGNHKGTWYCITDCPAGDTPGPIADMRAWASRSGWAIPKKPKNVREFMDKPVKPGAFQE